MEENPMEDGSTEEDAPEEDIMTGPKQPIEDEGSDGSTTE